MFIFPQPLVKQLLNKEEIILYLNDRYPFKFIHFLPFRSIRRTEIAESMLSCMQTLRCARNHKRREIYFIFDLCIPKVTHHRRRLLFHLHVGVTLRKHKVFSCSIKYYLRVRETQYIL